MKPTLRSRFERFCYAHRDRGIPNLMLIVAIGTAIVYVLSYIDPSNLLYRVLCWDTTAILHGQVWRLFSYVFIPDAANLLLLAISLLFDWYIGRVLEREWGRMRFTIYYLTGVVLMDLVALATGTFATAYYLNLSLFLAFATLYPENMVLIFFIIPLKMKYLAWFYFALTLLDMVQALLSTSFPTNLLLMLIPLVPLLNYFLFFGKDVLEVLPFVPGGKLRAKRAFQQFRDREPNPDWARKYQSHQSAQEKAYRFKCTVCGRTDTDYPELEFRFCSRCNGYYCYCADHINNHVHIQ